MERNKSRLRIIDAFRKIQGGEIDPFSFDVKKSIPELRNELKADDLQELSEDAGAVNALSGIVNAQGSEVEFLVSSSAMNPFLLEKTVEALSVEEIAWSLWRSMTPSVDIAQLTAQALKLSLKYKGKGKKIHWQERSDTPVKTKINQGQEFEPKLNSIIQELKELGETDYSSFLNKGDRLERAYLLSFAVTEGMVALKIDPINKKAKIVVLKEKAKTDSSVVIPLEEF